jgi:predicted glycosyltransferase
MKTSLLVYCQHSLGLGHFVRSLALAEAVTEHFSVVFFNGGPVPEGFVLPDNIRFEHLPPIRMQDDGSIIGDIDIDQLLAKRRDHMLAAARETGAKMLVVELYPFGRKKFAVEIDPLIEAVRAQGGRVACSVRDVLVTARVDQARHDDRAAQALNRFFDCVLVHTDERLFALLDSFTPATPLSIPVEHTGYIVRSRQPATGGCEDGPTLVAAGGGAVGQALYRAALAAQRNLFAAKGWQMTLVAGPLFPEADWDVLYASVEGVPGLTLVRSLPSLTPLLARAGRFVGQCGYNSALEVCQAGLPALFVPFARGQESEQTARAEKLKDLGLADWMPEAGLTGAALAEHILALYPPVPGARIDLDGAQKSAGILREMALCSA